MEKRIYRGTICYSPDQCRVCGLDSGEEECAEHFFLDTDYVFICLVCKVTFLEKVFADVSLFCFGAYG